MAAISKPALFEKVGYRPHSGQQPLHRATERNRVVAAGRRIGKSTAGGHELIPHAYRAYFQRDVLADQGKRLEYWIVGPEYSDAEKEFRVLYDRLSRLKMPFDKPGTYNNPLTGDMHISLWDGRYQVHAKSAKHPETLVGEGLSGVICAEAAKLKERVWTKYLRATLSDFRGWALFTSTPEGKNWFYDLWRKGQDPAQTEWWSMRAPSWLNPNVFPQGGSDAGVRILRDALNRGEPLTGNVLALSGVDTEIVSLMQDLTEPMFKQEIAADFTEFVGRVFGDFDEEVHVTDLVYDPSLPCYAAVDYGWTNPFVWLLIQVDRSDNVRVLGEYYERNVEVEQAARDIMARGLCPSQVKAFYPDPASPGDTATLERLLHAKGRPGTGGEIKDRVDWIRRFLKVPPFLAHLPAEHPDRLPRLMFDRSCTNSIADFLNYRYPERQNESLNSPENPMKKDDHAPEALGRFFKGHYGAPEQRRSRQRSAVMAQ